MNREPQRIAMRVGDALRARRRYIDKWRTNAPYLSIDKNRNIALQQNTQMRELMDFSSQQRIAGDEQLSTVKTRSEVMAHRKITGRAWMLAHHCFNGGDLDRKS